jgi:hypothetical protein
MIDNLVLLVTTSVIIYVVIRAVQLDKTLPWFTAGQPTPTASPQDTAPRWRGRPTHPGRQRTFPAGTLRRQW